MNPVRSVYTFPADSAAHYDPCQDRGKGINVATSAGRGEGIKKATLIHRSQVCEFNSKAQPLLALKRTHYSVTLATQHPYHCAQPFRRPHRNLRKHKAEMDAEKKFGPPIFKECVFRRVFVSWISDLPAVCSYIMTRLSLWMDNEEFDE